MSMTSSARLATGRCLPASPRPGINRLAWRVMPDPNLFPPEWDVVLSDPPFRAQVSRVAHRAGADELGALLFEVEPGGAVSPYHVHHGNEEMLIVLAGRPELR